MENKDRKFLFDVNIFDAPEVEEVVEDLPPPPPTFSEEELAVAKDLAFEQGRQQGQKEQIESREQYVAQTLEKIADSFSHLFAAEQLRENIFEREALKLSVSALDLLFPLLNEKIGRDEVLKVVEKTLSDHRKTKEITILVPVGFKGEIETIISRIRKDEHEEAIWKVLEDPSQTQGDCSLEWSDGGAIRDSGRTARNIRKNLESLLGSAQDPISEMGESDVSYEDKGESVKPAEKNDE